MRQVFENLWHLMADRVECRILGAYGEGMQELCEFGSVLSQTLLMLLCGKRGSKQKPSRSRNPSDRSPIVSATDRMICRQLRVKNWILRLRLIFLFFFFFFCFGSLPFRFLQHTGLSSLPQPFEPSYCGRMLFSPIRVVMELIAHARDAPSIQASAARSV